MHTASSADITIRVQRLLWAPAVTTWYFAAIFCETALRDFAVLITSPAPGPQVQPAAGGITLEVPLEGAALAGNSSACLAFVANLQVGYRNLSADFARPCGNTGPGTARDICFSARTIRATLSGDRIFSV
jgi:hypothetical protein